MTDAAPTAAVAFEPATPAFAPVMETLHAAAVRRDEPYWKAMAFEALLESPPVAGRIASRAGEPAGFVLWRTVADEAEILLLAVMPALRRAGIGRGLLRRALASAHAAGAATVWLEVAADNHAPLALYRSEGFKQVAMRRNYYARLAGARADALVLRREMPPDVEIFIG